MATNCDNCGFEAVKSIEVDGEKFAPSGGILVCPNCHQAVDPNGPAEPEADHDAEELEQGWSVPEHDPDA